MRLLFFAGSAREGSYNKKLARLGRHVAEANGIEAVFVDLKDYPMPIYNGDLEAAEGPPERIVEAPESATGMYLKLMLERASVKPVIVETQPKRPRRTRRVSIDEPDLIAAK